jgi:predicted nucleotidyltransferase
MSEDDALTIIRDTLRSQVTPLAMYLFGSRSVGTARSDSDYDLLVVIDGNADQKERIALSSKWRGQLAQKGLDADILVKTPREIDEYRDRIGSVIKEALETGIEL